MIVCLIGRHGSGKSKVGEFFSRHGFTHISIGDLKRMSHRRILPETISPTLMGILRMEKRNSLLSWRAATMIADLLKSKRQVSIDGFPVCPEQLELLPEDTVIVYCTTPKSLRERRLIRRGKKTGRHWDPDLISVRDTALPELVIEARKRFRFIYHQNGPDTVSIYGKKLLKQLMPDVD